MLTPICFRFAVDYLQERESFRREDESLECGMEVESSVVVAME